MPLQSKLLGGDPKLEAAAVSDPAHLVPGARGPHVGKVQAALNAVDQAGLTRDDAYGARTAAAVRAFKQKRRIVNAQGLIDDIVGKKTIAALDAEMLRVEGGLPRPAPGPLPPPGPRPAPPPPGPRPGPRPKDLETRPIRDFVVRFRAGTTRDARENLLAASLAEHARKGRGLQAISREARIGDQALIQGVIAEIDRVLAAGDVRAGIICINGNSAGARNALELAAALSGRRAIKFVGCADAALFPDLPNLNAPEPDDPVALGGKARNVPLWQGAPSFVAEIKKNFFQNEQNRWRRRIRGLNPVWASTDLRSEIHGKLAGFNDDGGIEVKVPAGVDPHVFAGDLGDRANGVIISDLLARL
jgi:hypothetical protein